MGSLFMGGKVLPFLFLTLLVAGVHGSNGNERKPYIVYLGRALESEEHARTSHHSLLTVALGDEELARSQVIHSYHGSFNAFAAALSPEEATKLRGLDGVVSVFPNTVYKPQTTRSWDYVGLTENVRRSSLESDIIVGVIDTGAWPYSPFFNDEGFGPPPSKWKGVCDKSHNFTCNNKLIGGRFFKIHAAVNAPDLASPIDTDGHGTHTTSTIAGKAIEHASLFGVGEGTGRGGVPSARVAVYKACWLDGCNSVDILAAFDAAVQDGVDFISVSIGGPPEDYFSDVMAIGSFHAMKKGILTSLAAGNSGTNFGVVSNVAPWVLTVAANGIDRQYRTVIELGNGKKIEGVSINAFSPTKKMYPLITGLQAALPQFVGSHDAEICNYEALDEEKVRGKVLFCDYNVVVQDGIKLLGGVGAIHPGNPIQKDVAFVSSIPEASIDDDSDLNMLRSYLNSTNPEAVIHRTTEVRTGLARIPYFSSRGPSPVSDYILKPDVSAPGVDILAGTSRLASLSDDDSDDRKSDFNIMSGTSMACPHVTATAAYVKSFHPDWSPAAIKSAIMTSARDMTSNATNPDGELGFGSGMLSPTRAVFPGLVYDIKEADYVRQMCLEGYDSVMMQTVTGGDQVDCSASAIQDLGHDGLNYPSMQLRIKDPNVTTTATFKRTVTNVGPTYSVYKVVVKAPDAVSIDVRPKTMVFDAEHKEGSFEVVVRADRSMSFLRSGSISWVDGRHSVRSPVAVVVV